MKIFKVRPKEYYIIIFNKKIRYRDYYWYVKEFFVAIMYRFLHNRADIKGVVYSAVTGGYDNCPMILNARRDLDYILFSDNEKLIRRKRCGVWQVKPLAFDRLDNIKNARWHKTHPHNLFKEYDLSFWIDGNAKILSSKLYDIAFVGGGQNLDKMLVPLHFSRNCIFEEIDACLELGRDEPENIVKIKEFLLKEKMPYHYGLNETNILIRFHHKAEVVALMEQWWRFIEQYSRRDQLSFSYVLWKNNIAVKDISFENARFDIKNFWFGLHKK